MLGSDSMAAASSPPQPRLGDGSALAALLAWVGEVTGATVTRAEQLVAGTRGGWAIDVDRGPVRQLFLRRDLAHPRNPRPPYDLAREATVLRALADTSVPVPRVVAMHPDGDVILLERARGDGDFTKITDNVQRQRVAENFMRHLAVLHRLDPAGLSLGSMAVPGTPLQHVTIDLDGYEQLFVEQCEPDPVLAYALRWLRDNAPTTVPRTSLVQGDCGPGNFLYDGETVTAIVDWERAHLSEPHEDLGWLVVRSMLWPFGDLRTLFAVYENAGGGRVDLGRVRYWVVSVLTLGAVSEASGLVHDLGNAELPIMLSGWALHRRLLMRLLAQPFGFEPDPLDVDPEQSVDTMPAALLDHAVRELREVVLPALTEPLANHRARAILRSLRALALGERIDPVIDRIERGELSVLLGAAVENVGDGKARLQHLIRSRALGDERAVVRYLVSTAERDAQRWRPLIGPMSDAVIPLFSGE